MGRGRPMAPLALDGAERETLEQWTRRPKTNPGVGPAGFLACADWPPSGYVLNGGEMAVPIPGVDGLLDQPRSGRPRMIDCRR